MQDALQVLQASTTKTATFNSTGVNIGGSPSPTRALVARVRYSAASTSSGAGAATFRVTESDDDSSYGGAHQSPEAALTLSTTAIAGVLHIPFVTKKKYVRLELSAISGTGATVTYESDIQPAQP